MDNNKITNLVISAQKGDSTALNELFNATYNDIYYFALKTLKSEDLACDITQDTFVAIIDNINSLNEPAAFMGWAKKIAYSKCTRYFNKKKDVLVEEDEDGNSIFDIVAEDKAEFIPDEALDQAEFKKAIHDILNILSEEQRSAVMMYYFDEMSVREIAEIQGVSEGTVKSRLNYARKAIKNAVEDYEKKNNVKLHALPFFPFLRWIVGGTFEGGLPYGSAASMAESISASTGVSITATQGGATPSAGITEGATPSAGITEGATPSAGVTEGATPSAGVTEGVTPSAGASATAGAFVEGTAAVGASSVAAASATSAAGVGLGAKIASIPLVAKIIAGIVAVALVAIGAVAIINNVNDNKKKGGGSGSGNAAVEIVNGVKIGKYTLYSFNGMDYNTLKAMGLDKTYIKLNSDGGLEFYLPPNSMLGFNNDGSAPPSTGGSIYGSYDAGAKTVTLDGETRSFTVDGDLLTLDPQQLNMVFKFAQTSNSGLPSGGSSNNSAGAVNGVKTGKYTLYSAYGMDADALKNIGLENSYMKFNADGSLEFSFAGETVYGSYDANAKTVTLDGDTRSFTVDGDLLTLDPQQLNMVFKLS